MHYQTLIDLVMAAPTPPQGNLAGPAGQLLSAAAASLGRKIAPEISGLLPTIARPNSEQWMSGETHAGRLVSGGQPQFHQLDPILAPAFAAAARGLLPLAAFQAVPAARALVQAAPAHAPHLPRRAAPARLGLLRAPLPAPSLAAANSMVPDLSALVPNPMVAY